ncbi:hypothetical protein AUK11_03465 [bacterium CG2_30_37_16]|nr:MAG: hypothetical protein AUK11_03465 [bacterium CG2_30_37_16]PIP31247.1 MAG: cell shape determination protein CcmA [bacterium (Candidatus Howlettbacteria) CG23_combo_of_CG06-09_8_20_14_all_37_9]PIY00040.1 MAG: cell shape determination protein CcmA [bacterium (Candidatus Howlettbacteria) CG_4_10_14_3_um_filter_37_10]PJB05306.1 MAG: cell shape determination protein CcmA [bacterium (Candidatus Howlettbacteria) CG_4_9_14_3_um_filter_37_10]
MAKKDDFFKMGAQETVIGHTVKLKGNLKSQHDIVIDGELTGDIDSESTVTIGHGAIVSANIKAKNVVISGNLEGDIDAEVSVEITQTGKVLGNIKAASLAIGAGAFFEGQSSMKGTKEPPFKTVTKVQNKDNDIKPFFE